MGEPVPKSRHDDALKALCRTRPAAILRLLGIELRPDAAVLPVTESLPAHTTYVDALLHVDVDRAVHIEFQAHAEKGFEYRMLDYHSRLARLEAVAGRQLTHHVVLLGAGNVPDGIENEAMSFRYTVHRVRDLVAESLLSDPVLAPFAPLAHVVHAQRPAVLRAALERIGAVTDHDLLRTLAIAAVTSPASDSTPLPSPQPGRTRR